MIHIAKKSKDFDGYTRFKVFHKNTGGTFYHDVKNTDIEDFEKMENLLSTVLYDDEKNRIIVVTPLKLSEEKIDEIIQQIQDDY